mgnify:CR=1 FL=1
MINNPLAQVGFVGGTLAPTSVAAVISAASYGGATTVTSSNLSTLPMILFHRLLYICSDFKYD